MCRRGADAEDIERDSAQACSEKPRWEGDRDSLTEKLCACKSTAEKPQQIKLERTGGSNSTCVEVNKFSPKH